MFDFVSWIEMMVSYNRSGSPIPPSSIHAINGSIQNATQAEWGKIMGVVGYSNFGVPTDLLMLDRISISYSGKT